MCETLGLIPITRGEKHKKAQTLHLSSKQNHLLTEWKYSPGIWVNGGWGTLVLFWKANRMQVFSFLVVSLNLIKTFREINQTFIF